MHFSQAFHEPCKQPIYMMRVSSLEERNGEARGEKRLKARHERSRDENEAREEQRRERSRAEQSETRAKRERAE